MGRVAQVAHGIACLSEVRRRRWDGGSSWVRGGMGEDSVEAEVGAVEEGGELGEAEGEALGRGGADRR